MDCRSFRSIACFCIDQYGDFDEGAWMRRGAADGKLVAVAAKYLSLTGWFGYEESLEHIATAIHADMASSAKFNRECRTMGPDLALFSDAVRCGIAAKSRATVNAGNAHPPLRSGNQAVPIGV